MRYFQIASSSATFLILISFVIMPTVDALDEGIGSAEVRDPDLTIEMDQNRVDVNVHPGAEGVADFSGTVYCDLPPGTPPGKYIIVYLQANAGGWVVSLPPPLIFDMGTSCIDFELEVTLPPQTLSGAYELEVYGTWSASPGVQSGYVDEVVSEIFVNPYSRVEMGSENKQREAPVGSWCDFELFLKNEGNVEDRITLMVKPLSDLDIRFDGGEIIIPYEGNITVNMSFRQGSGMGKNNAIEINKTTEVEKDLGMDTYTFYLKSKTSVKGTLLSPVGITVSAVIILVVALVAFLAVRKIKGGNIRSRPDRG